MSDTSSPAAVSANSGPDLEFLCLIWITAVTFMGFYSPQPLLSTISREFGVSQSQTGLLMTFVIAPFAIGPFIYGRALRALSLRRLLGVLLSLAALTLLPPALATWFPMLLLCRLGQGLLLPGILMCLTTRIASRYSGPLLQRKMALYATATSLGAFSGRVLCGYIGARWSWQTAFVVLALAQASALLPLLRVRNAAGTAAAPFRLDDIRALFANRNLRPVLCIAPLCIFCHASLLNILPFYLHRLDPGMSDFMIGLVYVGGVIGALVGFGSKLLIRLLRGEWNVILAGIGLFAAALPALLLQSVPGTVLTVLGTSLAFSMIYTTTPGLINRASHLPKSLTNSVYLGFYYLLSALGTYLPVLLFSRGGLHWYEALLSGVCALMLGATAYARKNSRLD